MGLRFIKPSEIANQNLKTKQNKKPMKLTNKKQQTICPQKSETEKLLPKAQEVYEIKVTYFSAKKKKNVLEKI